MLPGYASGAALSAPSAGMVTFDIEIQKSI